LKNGNGKRGKEKMVVEGRRRSWMLDKHELGGGVDLFFLFGGVSSILETYSGVTIIDARPTVFYQPNASYEPRWVVSSCSKRIMRIKGYEVTNWCKDSPNNPSIFQK
jgi:hypothetical protein